MKLKHRNAFRKSLVLRMLHRTLSKIYTWGLFNFCPNYLIVSQGLGVLKKKKKVTRRGGDVS